jgi:hypothetical protein
VLRLHPSDCREIRQVAAKAIADAMPGSRLESVTAAAHLSLQKIPRCSTI